MALDISTIELSLREFAQFAELSEERARTLLREGKVPGADKRLDDRGKEVWFVPGWGAVQFLEDREKNGTVTGTRSTGVRRVSGLKDGDEEAILANFPHLTFSKGYYTPSEEAKARQAANRERAKEAAREKMEALKAQLNS